MHVISKKRLDEFSKTHPPAEQPLADWFNTMRRGTFTSFADLRRIFPSADQVGTLTVFNIGGNKYRLIAAIHYNRGKVYIRHILTHAEYDRNTWKEGN